MLSVLFELWARHATHYPFSCLTAFSRGNTGSYVLLVSYELGDPAYEENIIVDCFGKERLEEYRGKHKLDVMFVYGAHPNILEQAPGGRDNAKMVSDWRRRQQSKSNHQRQCAPRCASAILIKQLFTAILRMEFLAFLIKGTPLPPPNDFCACPNNSRPFLVKQTERTRRTLHTGEQVHVRGLRGVGGGRQLLFAPGLHKGSIFARRSHRPPQGGHLKTYLGRANRTVKTRNSFFSRQYVCPLLNVSPLVFRAAPRRWMRSTKKSGRMWPPRTVSGSLPGCTRKTCFAAGR